MFEEAGNPIVNQDRQAKDKLIDRAQSMVYLGRWKTALLINEKITSEYPTVAADYNRLGWCYFNLGDLPRARDAYEKSLKLDATNVIAKKNYDRINAKIGRSPGSRKKDIKKSGPPQPPPNQRAARVESSFESKFQRTSRVRIIITGKTGIITDILPEHQYKLFINEQEEPIVSEDDIELIKPEVGYVNPQQFLRDLLIFKMKKPLSDTLYSYSMSRTNFEAYQFKPAIKFLNNPYGRILIADEVGLGKTIEACIIYLELKARMRGELSRVLVVCPSGLRDKWRSELSVRFGEEFDLMGSREINTFFNDFRNSGGNTRLRGICSIEGLRREDFNETIAEMGIDFDLVIIDEAHHMRNPETQSFDLGETLSAHTDNLVMLTATPVQLSSDDLFYLMSILEPGEFESREGFQAQLEPNKYLNKAIEQLCKIPANLEGACTQLDMCPPYMKEHPYWKETRSLIQNTGALERDKSRLNMATAMRNLSELNTFSLLFTRTRRKEVQSGVLRSASVINVQLAPKEKDIYEQALRFARARARSKRGYVGVLGLIQIERQIASSIGAFKEIIEAFSTGHQDTTGIEASVSDLGWFNSFPAEDVNAIGAQLNNLYRDLGDKDTKYDTFQTELSEILKTEPSAKIIVYSFFRKTLAYLHKKLIHNGYKIEMIHGGIPVSERQKIMDKFKQDNELNILLSSEVGSEGLDLQFSNTVINYDLPWNPMRVEQRIGRVDRYGQQSDKIRIISLFLAGTIEQRILERLYDRIGIFEESIGGLEPILGDIVSKLSQDVISAELTPEEERRRTEESLRTFEHKKLELENYEKHRYELLGQDMSFVNQVDNNINSGRFVSSKEIRALVFQYFLKECPRTVLEPISKETDNWLLIPDDMLISKLQGFIYDRKNHAGREDHTFLGLLIESTRPQGRTYTMRTRGIPITFSSRLAMERPRLLFINVWHSLTKLAFESLSTMTQTEPATRIIKLNLKDKIPRKTGIYYFFLFYMSTSAMVDSNEIITIVLDSDGIFNQDLSASFLKLQNDIVSENSLESEVDYDIQLSHILKTKALEYMAEQKKLKEALEQQRNDSLIAIRRASLEKTFEVKKNRAEFRLATASDRRIIRMHQAELSNLENKRLSAIRELQTKKRISISYEHIASGLLDL